MTEGIQRNMHEAKFQIFLFAARAEGALVPLIPTGIETFFTPTMLSCSSFLAIAYFLAHLLPVTIEG